MNARELQTFNKKTRRRLFAWEVLAVIHDGKLKSTESYVGTLYSTVTTSVCHSCAIGAAYVFGNGWCDVPSSVKEAWEGEGRPQSFQSMKKMGFKDDHINLIEWLYEDDHWLGSDTVELIPLEVRSKFRGLKAELQELDRMPRMEALYRIIFNSKNGIVELEDDNDV